MMTSTPLSSDVFSASTDLIGEEVSATISPMSMTIYHLAAPVAVGAPTLACGLVRIEAQ